MPVKRVVVEVELRIERQHLALFGHDERVHLHHRAIERDEGAIKSIEQLRGRLDLRRGESELPRQLARLVRLNPGQPIDRLTDDLLRRLLRDRLDLHAAFRARHDHRRAGRAIEQNGEVNLALDLDRLRDQDRVHHAPGGARFDASPAFARASSTQAHALPSGDLHKCTPPLKPFANVPFPRPPAWTCAFTTRSCVAEFARRLLASSGVRAAFPGGVATPNLWSNSFA